MMAKMVKALLLMILLPGAVVIALLSLPFAVPVALYELLTGKLK